MNEINCKSNRNLIEFTINSNRNVTHQLEINNKSNRNQIEIK